MYKVLIADDHPLFRNALKQVLMSQSMSVQEGHALHSEQIQEAQDLSSTIGALSADIDIDLLFLDLNMPGNDGLSSISTIRAQFPNLLIIIVSADEQEHTISKCIQLGASAYIPKSVDLSEIAQAVEQVLQGEQWLPKDIQLTEHAPQETAFFEQLAQLTPHQLKVLGLIAKGLLNKQIAYELNISESTVKQHASAVLKKLGVYNRTQAGVIFNQVMRGE
jgi:DNA-binding NarL/FixJ family response regulator